MTSPFKSTIHRFWGSPFRGYQGDYSVSHDERWQASLRKYQFPETLRSPRRSPRRRSQSPARRAHTEKLGALLRKADVVHHDLHRLTSLVSAWAAQVDQHLMTSGESALLLQLKQMMQRLVSTYSQHAQAMAASSYTSKLAREHSELGKEVHHLIRICRVLLDLSRQQHRRRRAPHATRDWSDSEEEEYSSDVAAPQRSPRPALHQQRSIHTATAAYNLQLAEQDAGAESASDSEWPVAQPIQLCSAPHAGRAPQHAWQDADQSPPALHAVPLAPQPHEHLAAAVPPASAAYMHQQVQMGQAAATAAAGVAAAALQSDIQRAQHHVRFPTPPSAASTPSLAMPVPQPAALHSHSAQPADAQRTPAAAYPPSTPTQAITEAPAGQPQVTKASQMYADAFTQAASPMYNALPPQPVGERKELWDADGGSSSGDTRAYNTPVRVERSPMYGPLPGRLNAAPDSMHTPIYAPGNARVHNPPATPTASAAAAGAAMVAASMLDEAAQAEGLAPQTASDLGGLANALARQVARVRSVNCSLSQALSEYDRLAESAAAVASAAAATAGAAAATSREPPRSPPSPHSPPAPLHFPGMHTAMADLEGRAASPAARSSAESHEAPAYAEAGAAGNFLISAALAPQLPAAATCSVPAATHHVLLHMRQAHPAAHVHDHGAWCHAGHNEPKGLQASQQEYNAAVHNAVQPTSSPFAAIRDAMRHLQQSSRLAAAAAPPCAPHAVTSPAAMPALYPAAPLHGPDARAGAAVPPMGLQMAQIRQQLADIRLDALRDRVLLPHAELHTPPAARDWPPPEPLSQGLCLDAPLRDPAHEPLWDPQLARRAPWGGGPAGAGGVGASSMSIYSASGGLMGGAGAPSSGSGGAAGGALLPFERITADLAALRLQIAARNPAAWQQYS